ncbi:PucR family transcriptional regulator [Streptomyces tendae]|uniref:PucR family transcriptional regulator n=1 Tax=Streptomyces tendae TaxID=1932 RepID=UPI0036AB91BA
MTRASGGDPADDGVQDGVDLLEVALGRPVILEDTEFRPIAYSRQPDDIDGARLHVILHRGVEPEFLRMYQALGISSASGPVWTPAFPEWNAESRLCIPVRRGRTLLAYLWVLAPEGSLSEQQVAAAAGTASFIATALDAQRRQRRGAEQNNQMVLARILDSDYGQANLVAHLTTADNLPPDSRVVVAAFECTGGPPDDQDVIDTALMIKERLPLIRLPVRWMVHLGSRPGVLAVLGPSAQVTENEVAHAVQKAVHSCFSTSVAVGTGGGPVSLEEIKEAYDRACVAAWVARVTTRGSDGTLSWSDIGSWRLLARLAGRSVGGSDLTADLHPGLLRLLSQDRGELVATLDAYLTTGGDVRTTADLLHLHRSTLYYRVDRISEITGANLRDGEARFELTLGLRVAALLGLLPSTTPQAD